MVYENTIRNCHLLSLDVIPLSFTEVDPSDLKGMAHFAVKHSWHIFQCQSPKGIPVLRHMYLEAQRKSNTTFYCYANSDILFYLNLIGTEGSF